MRHVRCVCPPFHFWGEIHSSRKFIRGVLAVKLFSLGMMVYAGCDVYSQCVAVIIRMVFSYNIPGTHEHLSPVAPAGTIVYSNTAAQQQQQCPSVEVRKSTRRYVDGGVGCRSPWSRASQASTRLTHVKHTKIEINPAEQVRSGSEIDVRYDVLPWMQQPQTDNLLCIGMNYLMALIGAWMQVQTGHTSSNDRPYQHIQGRRARGQDN